MRTSRTARRVARLAAVGYALVVSLLVSAGPALASYHPDDGETPGKPLGIGLTIFYFVVIPLGAFLIIGGLAVLPSALSRPRYRPGKEWDFESEWFGGPEDSTGAPADATGSTARGGASAEW